MVLIVERAHARDMTCVVDRAGFPEDPSRALGQAVVEIDHLAVLPEKDMRSRMGLVCRGLAHDLTRVIDRKNLSPGGIRKGAEICPGPVLPDERVRCATARAKEKATCP